MSPTERELAQIFAKTMQCNCDLDKWQPEKSTGHSHVCRIHIMATAKPHDRTLAMQATIAEIGRLLSQLEQAQATCAAWRGLAELIMANAQTYVSEQDGSPNSFPGQVIGLLDDAEIARLTGELEQAQADAVLKSNALLAVMQSVREYSASLSPLLLELVEKACSDKSGQPILDRMKQAEAERDQAQATCAAMLDNFRTWAANLMPPRHMEAAVKFIKGAGIQRDGQAILDRLAAKDAEIDRLTDELEKAQAAKENR